MVINTDTLRLARLAYHIEEGTTAEADLDVFYQIVEKYTEYDRDLLEQVTTYMYERGMLDD